MGGVEKREGSREQSAGKQTRRGRHWMKEGLGGGGVSGGVGGLPRFMALTSASFSTGCSQPRLSPTSPSITSTPACTSTSSSSLHPPKPCPLPLSDLTGSHSKVRKHKVCGTGSQMCYEKNWVMGCQHAYYGSGRSRYCSQKPTASPHTAVHNNKRL